MLPHYPRISLTDFILIDLHWRLQSRSFLRGSIAIVTEIVVFEMQCSSMVCGRGLMGYCHISVIVWTHIGGLKASYFCQLCISAEMFEVICICSNHMYWLDVVWRAQRWAGQQSLTLLSVVCDISMSVKWKWLWQTPVGATVTVLAILPIFTSVCT